jgi:hypothetical protein
MLLRAGEPAEQFVDENAVTDVQPVLLGLPRAVLGEPPAECLER